MIVIYHELKGSHVHARVFSGEEEGGRVLNGELIFSQSEWEDFQSVLHNDGIMLEIRGKI